MQIKNNQGFSIIELIVAIGIIAILAGVAVPNYKSYTYNARTAEAQSSLSQVYMAEKAFFLRWRFYSPDLFVIGMSPDGPLLYNVGFANGSFTVPDTYRNRGGQDLDQNNYNFYGLCGKEFGEGTVGSCAFKHPTVGSRNDDDEGFEPMVIPGTYSKIDLTGFTAIAIGDVMNIQPRGNTVNVRGIDIWSIDNYKQVVKLKKWDKDEPEN